MEPNSTSKPSVKVRLVALWLWLDGLYYVFNGVLFAALVFTLVSLALAANGAPFAIFNDHLLVIVIVPIIYAVIGLIYQYSSFKLLQRSKKAFVTGYVLIVIHFFLSIFLTWSINYFLQVVSSDNPLTKTFSYLNPINIFLILPLICIILLAVSYKEFVNSGNKVSIRAKVLITIFGIIPTICFIAFASWGLISSLDRDYGYTGTQAAVSFKLHKLENIPSNLNVAQKYQYKAETKEVSLILSSKVISDAKLVVVTQSDTKAGNAETIAQTALEGCKEESNNCELSTVKVSLSKTGNGTYIPSPRSSAQFAIDFDTEDGTTIFIFFLNMNSNEVTEVINAIR